MIGYIPIKRAVKTSAGWAAVAMRPLYRSHVGPHACILTYHRVAPIDFVDSQLDDQNVQPDHFERQLEGLAQYADVVRLDELPARLSTPLPSASSYRKPFVALTFDDGLASFHRHVLPRLTAFDLPATVFVVTSLVERGEVPAFDRWSHRHRDRVAPDVTRSMVWSEIEACLDTGRVTVGSHSHEHLNGRFCSAAQFVDETNRSREVLHARLGIDQGNVYAYPFGSSRLGFVPPAYRQAVVDAGYQLAVTSDLGMATEASDCYRLPRVEAHGLDSPSVLRAKAGGVLAPYHVIDRLRRQQRPDDSTR